jgi:hypothetical protein
MAVCGDVLSSDGAIPFTVGVEVDAVPAGVSVDVPAGVCAAVPSGERVTASVLNGVSGTVPVGSGVEAEVLTEVTVEVVASVAFAEPVIDGVDHCVAASEGGFTGLVIEGDAMSEVTGK